MKKRSKGVAFWGWLFIIVSIIGIIGEINSDYGLGVRIFTIFSGVAYLFCGFFILKLNEFARKAAIILGVISILSIPLYFSAISKTIDFDKEYDKKEQKIIQEVKPEYQEEALNRLRIGKKMAKKSVPFIFAIFMGIPLFIAELIPIYFFTRPKVKEQFIIKDENPMPTSST
ncbi:MAG: hypothetical protein ABH952_00950 [Candidatus Omnitrophota bacterium]